MYYKLSNLKNKNEEEFFRLFAGIPEDCDSLDLSNNDLGHRTSAELVQAFAAIPINVTSLDLRHNGLEVKSGAQLVEIFQAMPTNIQSVHLYDESNDFVRFQKISAMKEKINHQIASLATSRVWISIGVIKASDAKIRALEDLKALFLNSFGKKQDTFHDELSQWKKNNWDCIARQRNVVHRFFSPHHKPASAIMIDDIFKQLGFADKVTSGFAWLKNPLVGSYKPTKPVTAKKIQEVEQLIKKINGMVDEEIEAKSRQKKEDGFAKVSEIYINRLIENLKDITFSKIDIWHKLDQMSYKDIKLLVSKLCSDKQKKHGSSELDYLWRQFQSLEFEPSLMQGKRNKFAEIVEVLSEEQLKASFDSPDFLKILNQDIYAEALANTLNYKQMALFSSETKRHDILNKMIKKMKPAPDLFSKLVAIMPHASGVLRENLENQITHLPYEASFKVRVVELERYYTDANYQAYKAATKPVDGKPRPKEEKAPSKWEKITGNTKPFYNNQPVRKTDWTEQAFDRFIQDLNAPMYITNKDKIIKDLNSMSDDRIKMIVERASSPHTKNLLQHLWVVESTTTNHNSYTEARESRLKIILENLSDAQLITAVKDNRFWEIFRNTQQPYCKMAAAVLTPKQFKTIISKAKLCRHSDLARIILFINKDTLQDKRRLNEIIEAILPHTTPWLVLTLQLKICELTGTDKIDIQRLNADLKKYLTESMKRKNVCLQYMNDKYLDKTAVSNLFMKDIFSKTDEPLEGEDFQKFSL